MTVCPEEIRTSGRRRGLQKGWRSPEWKEQKRIFIAAHPLCRFHQEVLAGVLKERFSQVPAPGWMNFPHSGTPLQIEEWLIENDCEDLLPLVARTQTPHHPYLESYKKGYMAPEVIAQCTPVCNSCHYMIRKGRRLCPRCGLHYAPWDANPPLCRPCFDELHPEIVQARERKAREFKELRRRLNHEAREKAKWRWLRTSIKNMLQARIKEGRYRTNRINQDVESILTFILTIRNPLSISRASVLERLVEEWVRE